MADSRLTAPISGSATSDTTEVELVVCETCRTSSDDDAAPTTGAPTHGSQLRDHLLDLLADEPGYARAGLRVGSTRCLWACKRGCNVHVRSAARASYVLCELPATRACARALLDYAVLYAQSPDGSVPFRTWPDDIRGHFLCRLPDPDHQPTRSSA